MARDAKPDEIELKKTNYSTKKRELCAERLLEHWDGNITFEELEEMYQGEDDPSASLYRKVYNEHFGLPGDDRTVEEIRAQFGSMKNYLDERKHGNIRLDTNEMTDRELSLFQEGYQLGNDDGFDRGWDKALALAKRKGVDNVPKMEE